jgi:hypothetical protein
MCSRCFLFLVLVLVRMTSQGRDPPPTSIVPIVLSKSTDSATRVGVIINITILKGISAAIILIESKSVACPMMVTIRNGQPYLS